MKFEKKLIILKGLDYDCKGTVSLEKNASSLKCSVNTYDLEDIDDGEYYLAVHSKDLPVAARALGSLGKISTRFDLPPALDIEQIHCVVAHMDKSAQPVMYGTLSPNKLWRGNMTDGLERMRRAFGSGFASEYPADASYELPAAPSAEAAPQTTAYSKGKLTDYFLDIVPPNPAQPPQSPKPLTSFFEGPESYDDTAIAEVNYYSGAATAEYTPEGVQEFFGPPLDYSTLSYTPPDYGAEPLPPMPPLNDEPPPLTQPADLYKQYIYETAAAVTPSAPDISKPVQAAPPIAEPMPEDIGFSVGIPENPPPAVPEADIAPTLPAANPELPPIEEPLPVPPPKSLKALDDAPKNPSENTVSAQSISEQNSSAPHAIPTIRTYSAGASARAAKTARVRPLTFFDKTRGQIELLFDKYPAETRLASLIEESRWVKVDWDNRGRHYVVGLIGPGPSYISYGVPGKYSPTPPTELDGYCQWLPVDPQSPDKDGYWLMYQDAKTGESVIV